MKENFLTLKKSKADNILTDPDNGGDIAFLVDTTVLVEYLLVILEEVAKCIDLLVDKDDY